MYKQIAFEWQIAKQLSGLIPVSLSNNKYCKLKKSGVFLCSKRKTAVKPTIHQFSAALKNCWENFKITGYKFRY